MVRIQMLQVFVIVIVVCFAFKVLPAEVSFLSLLSAYGRVRTELPFLSCHDL